MSDFSHSLPGLSKFRIKFIMIFHVIGWISGILSSWVQLFRCFSRSCMCIFQPQSTNLHRRSSRPLLILLHFLSSHKLVFGILLPFLFPSWLFSLGSHHIFLVFLGTVCIVGNEHLNFALEFREYHLLRWKFHFAGGFSPFQIFSVGCKASPNPK